MTHQAPIPGWYAPVFQSLAQPILTAGVPSDFFMFSMIATLAIALMWWPVIVLQGGAYLMSKRLTAWDPLWIPLLWRYFSYASRYEG